MGEDALGEQDGRLPAVGGRRAVRTWRSCPFANSLMLDFRCWIVPRFLYVPKDFEGDDAARRSRRTSRRPAARPAHARTAGRVRGGIQPQMTQIFADWKKGGCGSKALSAPRLKSAQICVICGQIAGSAGRPRPVRLPCCFPGGTTLRWAPLMCGIVGYIGKSTCGSHPPRRPAPARIPRLRFRRAGHHRSAARSRPANARAASRRSRIC